VHTTSDRNTTIDTEKNTMVVLYQLYIDVTAL